MVAAYRARYGARPDAVVRDPWASALAGEEGITFSRAFDRAFPPMELWTGMRTAYLDRQVHHWTARGASQVVLLGAGFDARAARLASSGVRFFEVDHPATQSEKLERLRSLEGYPIDAATYTSCDFEREDFLDRLIALGFEATRPSLIIWEGVVPYLSERAVRATVKRIATGCHSDTVLVFDYLAKRVVHGPDRGDMAQDIRTVVSDLGEPVAFGTDHPLPLLFEEGFAKVRQISFDEITLDITGTYDRDRGFRFQHVATATRTADLGL
jgi:methyltransferase (TIGR00027 family)